MNFSLAAFVDQVYCRGGYLISSRLGAVPAGDVQVRAPGGRRSL